MSVGSVCRVPVHVVQDFEPGDIVRLRSGGPWMTVTRVADLVAVRYVTSFGEMRRAKIEAEALVLIAHDQLLQDLRQRLADSARASQSKWRQ